MRSSIQDRINPYQGKQSPGGGLSTASNKIVGGDSAASFKDILMNSNLDAAKERAASKAGDLSGAKTDEDFFRILNERNNPQRGPKSTLDKDDFLKLFIAQLQNQDPLKPEDSAQMAAQLAQFNGLEQMLNVNKTLTEMLKGQNSGRNFGMLDYVGREVTIEGGRAFMSAGNAGQISFVIDRPVAGASLEVRDENGSIVATENLGQLQQGEQDLNWSGKGADGAPLKDGAYTFSISASSEEGQPVPVPVQTRVKVTGVDLKDPTGAFMTPAGKISASDVVAVRMVEEKTGKIATVSPPPPSASAKSPASSQPAQAGAQDADQRSDGAATATLKPENIPVTMGGLAEDDSSKITQLLPSTGIVTPTGNMNTDEGIEDVQR
jgi:flagellar basal-body rod modification protein FlgD